MRTACSIRSSSLILVAIDFTHQFNGKLEKFPRTLPTRHLRLFDQFLYILNLDLFIGPVINYSYLCRLWLLHCRPLLRTLNTYISKYLNDIILRLVVNVISRLHGPQLHLPSSLLLLHLAQIHKNRILEALRGFQEGTTVLSREAT